MSARELVGLQSGGWAADTRGYSAMALSTRPCRSSFSAFFSVSSRSRATKVSRGRPFAGGRVHRIKERLGAERSPVDVGVAEARDRVQVVTGGVALVPVEAVARIGRVQFQHHPVARDLGHD